MRTPYLGLAAAIAFGAADLATGLVALEPTTGPEPGSAKNRPGNNTPVPGGGARERARRLAKMSKQET